MEYFSQSSTAMVDQSEWYPEVWYGAQGLEVYEEIHQNEMNRLIHTLFLPGVFYGIFRAVPAILPQKIPTWLSIFCIMMLYTCFYATFDLEEANNTFFLTLPYAVMAYQAHQQSEPGSYQRHLLIGLGSMVTALAIQEVAGHVIYEEIPSRLTTSYILNAVMYSPLFYGTNMMILLPETLLRTGCLIMFSFFLYCVY